MMANGWWWVRSESDPRWNGKGEGIVGMFMIPEGARAHIEAKKLELGEPPEDLEWEYFKD